ncbi:MAG: hypothetical protein VXX63_00805 [Bacteroidota bacterium]|nr:hypothetical protein [Bacteroidota bacterium]
MDRLFEIFRKKELKKRRLTRENTNLRTMQNNVRIGVIYAVEDDQKEIENLVGVLKSEGKKVKCLGYCSIEKKHNDMISNYLYTYFSKKDCNWYGKPSLQSIQAFTSSDFDLIYALDSKGIFPLEYATMRSMAKLKFGYRNNRFPELVDIAWAHQKMDLIQFHNFVQNIHKNAS